MSFELLKGFRVTPENCVRPNTARCVSGNPIPFELLSKALPWRGKIAPPKSDDFRKNILLLMPCHQSGFDDFLNALERISKLVEQYKTQNVTYERDIPILQETVGGVWKKEDKLKVEVAVLERKIQLTLQSSSKPGRNKATNKGRKV